MLTLCSAKNVAVVFDRRGVYIYRVHSPGEVQVYESEPSSELQRGKLSLDEFQALLSAAWDGICWDPEQEDFVPAWPEDPAAQGLTVWGAVAQALLSDGRKAAGVCYHGWEVMPWYSYAGKQVRVRVPEAKRQLIELIDVAYRQLRGSAESIA